MASPHHPKSRPIHISPADQFINSPPPLFWTLSVFPREGGQIHTRSGPKWVHKLVRGRSVNRMMRWSARSKPTEFAQPHYCRVKARSSPARGYKFGCVCSYMAGHEDARVVTGHIGNKHTQICTPSLGRPRFDPTVLKRGCANSGGFGAR